MNKNIIVAVSGGIAAYKSVYLVRLLKKQGANVRVVMTAAASEFVTAMTFQAVSGHPVHDNLLDAEAEAAMGHIELAKWADLVIIAPATANTIANLAAGQAEQLLTAICLATASPVFVAPAMNQQMWAQSATQDNVQALISRRIRVLGPDSGEQACGDVGEGRMLEPEAIAEALEQAFTSDLLAGVQVLLTAGPTRESIDPVRYISNHSSGKMGYALAQAALEAGASVRLISGPCALTASDRIVRIDVESADDMLDAVTAALPATDIFISVAAVADYRVKEIAAQKIKKDDDELVIQLVRNPDILSMVSQSETRPFCVGFAAETENLQQHAEDKLERKKLDLVIANRVGQQDTGFNSDNNEAVAIWPEGSQHFALSSKTKLARDLVKLIGQRYLQSKN